MKKTIRFSLIAASLALAGLAHADQDAYSFQTAAGTSFTNYFSVTPGLTNELWISVSGAADQYSELSFKFLNGGSSFLAAVVNGNRVAAFNDWLNTDLNLTAGTAYTLEIKGVSKSPLPGTFGVVSITAIDGAVTAVPEPESYAMLLAGLGLMGTIARRRSKLPQA